MKYKPWNSIPPIQRRTNVKWRNENASTLCELNVLVFMCCVSKSWASECKFHIHVVVVGPLERARLKWPICDQTLLLNKYLWVLNQVLNLYMPHTTERFLLLYGTALLCQHVGFEIHSILNLWPAVWAETCYIPIEMNVFYFCMEKCFCIMGRDNFSQQSLTFGLQAHLI